MKELRSAYVSACVTPKLKERLEAIAVLSDRSLSQVAGHAISKGILLLEDGLSHHLGDSDDPTRENSPFFDSAAILSKKPYDAKTVAAKQREEKRGLKEFIRRSEKENAAKGKATK